MMHCYVILSDAFIKYYETVIIFVLTFVEIHSYNLPEILATVCHHKYIITTIRLLHVYDFHKFWMYLPVKMETKQFENMDMLTFYARNAWNLHVY